MLACWASDCEDRPSFQTLNEQLFDMQKEEHPYVNVDPSQDFILPPTAGQGEINVRSRESKHSCWNPCVGGDRLQNSNITFLLSILDSIVSNTA